MGYAQAIVAVAALGYQIYAGEDQKRRQKLNESRQGEAQKKALAASVAAKRSAEEDVARNGFPPARCCPARRTGTARTASTASARTGW